MEVLDPGSACSHAIALANESISSESRKGKARGSREREQRRYSVVYMFGRCFSRTFFRFSVAIRIFARGNSRQVGGIALCVVHRPLPRSCESIRRLKLKYPRAEMLNYTGPEAGARGRRGVTPPVLKMRIHK